MKDPNKTKTLGIFSRDAIAEGLQPIDNFKVEIYLGTWYDIARMTFDNEGIKVPMSMCNTQHGKMDSSA